MSVLDRFEEELASRLRELRPLAAEYHQLEQVAQRLGVALDDDRAATRGRRLGSAKRTPTVASATAARSAPTDKASARNATAQTSVATKPQPPGRTSARSTAKHRARTHRRSRRQDVLRLVHGRPGIAVKDIANELGVDATGLYRHVRNLQADGSITKHGTTLQPSSG